MSDTSELLTLQPSVPRCLLSFIPSITCEVQVLSCSRRHTPMVVYLYTEYKSEQQELHIHIRYRPTALPL